MTDYRTTIRAKVTNVARATSSKYGNPQFRVNMISENGEELEYLTEPDSMLAYGIGNKEYREQFHTFYINRAGRIGGRSGY